MATHAKYKLPVFWDDEYKRLEYVREPFNDPDSLAEWEKLGYTGPFTGYMCDMRGQQPRWNEQFIKIYKEMGWKDIGTSYYRMDTNTILPVHRDLYRRYVELFNLQGQEHTIRRAIVLLESWQSGHYLEVAGKPYVNWSAGDAVEWIYDIPHMAANIGLEDRYTLQITGHV